MEIIWRVISWEGEGGERGKGAGIKVQNRQGDVKNSVGNGVAKELICMTHGHERRGCWVERGAKGEILRQL